jgi:hypothetical protein
VVNLVNVVRARRLFGVAPTAKGYKLLKVFVGFRCEPTRVSCAHHQRVPATRNSNVAQHKLEFPVQIGTNGVHWLR